MKTFFYSFVLLFVSTVLWAQQSVNYVAFFPSAHVINNNVYLTQNSYSFRPNANTVPGDSANANINKYATNPGGLILGAAKEAVINIDEFMADNLSNGATFIGSILADNLLEINANGSITNLNLNCPGCTACSDDPNDENYDANCKKAFISAGGIKFSYAKEGGVCYIGGRRDFVIRSSGITNFGGGVLPAIPSGYHNSVKWVNLRLDGTEECRPYLVIRKTNQSELADNCNKPE